MKKRKRRKHSGAVKTYRYVKKQRRRRRRLHPVRRRQETIAVFIAVASVPLMFFIGIPGVVFSAVASAGFALASNGSPPSKVKRHRSVTPKTMPKMRGSDAIKLRQRRSVCSDACKYSTHKKSTCDCVCGGRDHGIWAWGPSGVTTPNQVRRRRS